MNIAEKREKSFQAEGLDESKQGLGFENGEARAWWDGRLVG